MVFWENGALWGVTLIAFIYQKESDGDANFIIVTFIFLFLYFIKHYIISILYKYMALADLRHFMELKLSVICGDSV